MKILMTLMFAGLLTGVAPAADEPATTKPVTIEQAEKKIADGVQLLDVRTEEEWDEGRVKGAKRVDVTADGFLEKAKAAIDPDKPVLVYCRSGGRSAKAVKQLREAGFETVYDMKGGFIAWEKAGKPVEK